SCVIKLIFLKFYKLLAINIFYLHFLRPFFDLRKCNGLSPFELEIYQSHFLINSHNLFVDLGVFLNIDYYAT
ncbi:MAG: hypothetical protein PWK00_08675, partial [Coxiella burnetii]|nr:hypothetical protein [Coxiella burnetii]